MTREASDIILRRADIFFSAGGEKTIIHLQPVLSGIVRFLLTKKLPARLGPLEALLQPCECQWATALQLRGHL